MRDADVRRALHEDLRLLHAGELDNTLFVDELGLCGEVRVDVAVVNGALSGFELKSARDTLTRLPRQVRTYSQVLDYASIVTAENHMTGVLKIVPKWWGVYCVKGDIEHLKIMKMRPPSFNPDIQAHKLGTLLWRSELLDALIQRGLDRGVRSKPRKDMLSRLVENVSLEELRMIVRESLKARPNWRSDPASN